MIATYNDNALLPMLTLIIVFKTYYDIILI